MVLIYDNVPRKSSGITTGAGTLDKGLRVLAAVEKAGSAQTAAEIAAAAGVHRLVRVLELHGYVRRSEDKRYRATQMRRRVAIGYAGPLTGNSFREDVARSIAEAASAAGIELLLLDNGDHDPNAAVAGARELIRARVDVAIFFQPDEAIGHMVADLLFEARIPFVTVERPIQGGVYFGANNFQAGKMAGNALGAWAREHWASRFSRLVLLEGTRTSTNVNARLAGVQIGLREMVGDFDESKIVHLDTHGDRAASRDAMSRLLAGSRRGQSRLLVSGFNDLSALGALEAVQNDGARPEVAIVGHNAMREGRSEIRREESVFFASVGYFPERYGAKLVELAKSLIAGEPVPPAVYTEHTIIDRKNIDRLYPGEGLR